MIFKKNHLFGVTHFIFKHQIANNFVHIIFSYKYKLSFNQMASLSLENSFRNNIYI